MLARRLSKANSLWSVCRPGEAWGGRSVPPVFSSGRRAAGSGDEMPCTASVRWTLPVVDSTGTDYQTFRWFYLEFRRDPRLPVAVPSEGAFE